MVLLKKFSPDQVKKTVSVLNLFKFYFFLFNKLIFKENIFDTH